MKMQHVYYFDFLSGIHGKTVMEYPAEIDMDDLMEDHDKDLLDAHDVMDVKTRNHKRCHCKAKR